MDFHSKDLSQSLAQHFRNEIDRQTYLKGKSPPKAYVYGNPCLGRVSKELPYR